LIECEPVGFIFLCVYRVYVSVSCCEFVSSCRRKCSSL